MLRVRAGSLGLRISKPKHKLVSQNRFTSVVCRCSAAASVTPIPASGSSGGSGSSSSSSSLIPDTLEDLAADTEAQAVLAALQAKGQAQLTREEAKARKLSLKGLGLPGFTEKLQESGILPLRRQTTTTLQLNIGLYCNQACTHCHVESSPARTEMMDEATTQRCLQLLAASNDVTCLDVTGGAPELNSQFRPLVRAARALSPDLTIIDRCNLTVLCEPGQEDLAEFLAQHRVRVVASLPCYGADNVDKQRGRGVFDRSIQGLKALNAVGYGQPGSGLVLDLVYNPGGAFLAPPQDKLQPAYKQELAEGYGIHFNSLLCLNNMPIKRFADWLIRQDKLSTYMAQLVEAFNPGAVPGLMCHNTLSVAWDGRLYDCDFNQQLELPLTRKAAATTAEAVAAAAAGGGGGGNASREYTAEPLQQQLAAQGAAAGHGSLSDSPPQASSGGAAAVAPETLQESQQKIELVGPQHQKPGLTVWDIASLSELTGLAVCTGSHCYGCTAGAGSSCQGATAAA